MMKFSICLFFGLAAVFLLTSCQSDELELTGDPNYAVKQSDRLTKSELQFLVRQAQKFASSKETNHSKMTTQQRTYVRTTQPEIVERYWGPKTGFLEMRWHISKKSDLILRSKGRLLKKKPNWEMEICVTKESAPVPEGLLKPELEKHLSLPPK